MTYVKTYVKDSESHSLSSKGKIETQGKNTGLKGGGANKAGKQANSNNQT